MSPKAPTPRPGASVRLRVEPKGAQRVRALARMDAFVEISRGGVRPSHEDAVLLPRGVVRGITVDRWQANVLSGVEQRTCPTAHLTDGRMALLTGLSRPGAPEPVRVMTREDGSRRWRPLLDAAGDELLWSADGSGEEALALALTRLVQDRCGPPTASPEVSAAVKLRSLSGKDPEPRARGLVGTLRAMKPNVSSHRTWTRLRD